MRICHFSDSHLGAGEGHSRRAASGLTCRQEDIIQAFVRAVDRIIQLKPNLCIHSGDLFHTVRPTNRIMAIAGEQLHRLADEAGIPTVIIAGNHDAPKQTHIGAALEVYAHIDNLHISAQSKLEVFEINAARICALPHCQTGEKLKQELSQCIPSSEAEHNLLVLHGVAAGMPEFSMADLGEQEIPLDILDRFDYTALGHYHNFTRVADRACYCGSTERLSQSEREHRKGFIEVELNPFNISFHEVETRPMVTVEAIDAAGKRGDELAQMIRRHVQDLDGSDKIIRLKVENISEETLKTIPTDVIASLKQQSYSLDISFEKEKTATSESKFGRAAIGKLDVGFMRFLDTVDLKGFDLERLKREAEKYLAEET